jgi:uncharacterized protein (TIGR03663 family)
MKEQRRFDTILFSLLILLVAVGALAFRLPRLEQRPMHTDEAVHAVKLGILLEKGVYEYDPQEYHGPTIYYFSLPFVWLSGARTYAEIPNEVPLRIAPVVFGAGLILLLLLMRDGLGRGAVVCAALLTAVSLAMVFYSRYYIQEILLVFFTFAAMGAAWRYTRTKRLGWALLAGACVGLMYASKETFVVACLAMLGGAALAAAWTRRVDHDELRLRDYVDRRHAAGAIAVAVVVGVLCLTVFMTQPRAIGNSLLSYVQYVQRAGTGDSSTSGAGLHNHPWYYYLKMLAFFKDAPGPWWSEALIMLLGLVGIGAALKRKPATEGNVRLLRLIAFYTILMTAVYSIVPYKTPWCMLSFLHGMILMAGVGAVALYRWLPGKPLKAILGILLALGVWHLGAQAHRGTDVFDSDPRNPYVYAQTLRTFLRLPKRAEQIADVHPDGRDMLIKVIVPGSDYWPLPWYLRRFTSVGYWNELPDDPDAAMIITAPELEADLDAALTDMYQKEYVGLRPGVLLLTYVRGNLWEEFIERMEQ